ncbi:MAG TPA: hypothetical protein VFU50_02450 [Terriglobales bacterium]|nr:hypothetical protein [Terriglobales bacterium]
MAEKEFLCCFQDRQSVVARYGRKILKKTNKGVAFFYVVDQRLNGNSRTREHDRSAHHVFAPSY